LNIFVALERSLCGCGNQRTHSGTNTNRALYNLRCSDWGSVWTEYRCPTHRAPPRSKTFRCRSCGNKRNKWFEI